MPRVTDGSSWCLSGWLAGNIVLCFPFWFDPHEHPSTPKTNRHTDKQGNKQTYEQTKTDQPFHTKMHTTLFLYRSQAAGQPVSQAASQPARQATLRTLPPKKRFQEKKREHPAVGGRFLIKALFKSCVSLRKNATFLKTYCFVVIKRMISYNFKNKKHQIHVREHGFGVWGCRGWVDPHVAEGVMASSLVAGSPKSHHDSSAYTHLHGRGGGRGANPRSCQMKVSKNLP